MAQSDLGIFKDITPVLDVYYQKRAKLFTRLIGTRIIDALLHIPYRIVEKKYVDSLSRKYENQTICIKCLIINITNPARNTRQPLKIHCQVGQEILDIVMFGKKISFYSPGETIYVVGKLTIDEYGRNSILHPDKISKLPSTISYNTGFFPIYALTTGVTQDSLYKLMHMSLNILHHDNIPEWHDAKTMQDMNLVGMYEAFSSIHSPSTISQNQKALDRISFDEILSEQIVIEKANSQISDGIYIDGCTEYVKQFITKIPFELTKSQVQAINEIIEDMASGKVMVRLLQGDVGSGKTIIAIAASMHVIARGYQVAILVPSEILAQQHYNNIMQYTDTLSIRPALLTSTTKNKKTIINGIASGAFNIVVGTHAIIQDNVQFQNLGFIVIDEQHKFGVSQRLSLINKGKNPHILSMSATPIPRTMVVSLYGDIHISTIDEKPNNRKEIITTSLPITRIMELIQSIKRVIARDERIYWVCPLIEEEEEQNTKTCVNIRYEFLTQYFDDMVGIIHGKLKEQEKHDVFGKFIRGEIKILVTTTVIEVGIDVKNATVMIIENSENFGLAQLHQLRGRVGRSNLQSYCILLHNNKISSTALQRIHAIKSTNDGFKIAEEDLQMRGGGEIIGTRQSGKRRYRTFDLEDITADKIQRMFCYARNLAKNIVKYDRIENYKVMLEIYNKHSSNCDDISNSL